MYAKIFILISLHIRHARSRWYTSDFHAVTIDNFTICPTVVPKLVSQHRKNLCQACV